MDGRQIHVQNRSQLVFFLENLLVHISLQLCRFQLLEIKTLNNISTAKQYRDSVHRFFSLVLFCIYAFTDLLPVPPVAFTTLPLLKTFLMASSIGGWNQI